MSSFRFRQFNVEQGRAAMKVGTDALLLGAMISTSGAQKALEVGAGTGVISLMLAQRDPGIHITAIEIDGPSADDCRQNFSNAPWNDRLELVQGNFLTSDFSHQFDLIVSNPPFYSGSLQNDDERKARSRHEAYLPFSELVSKSAELLTPGGKLWLIVPVDAHDTMIQLCSMQGLYPEIDCLVNGKPGKPVRSVLSFARTESTHVERKDFTVRDAEGNYSEEYKALTVAFHDREL